MCDELNNSFTKDLSPTHPVIKISPDHLDQWSVLDNIDDETLKKLISEFGLELQHDLPEVKRFSSFSNKLFRGWRSWTLAKQAKAVNYEEKLVYLSTYAREGMRINNHKKLRLPLHVGIVLCKNGSNWVMKSSILNLRFVFAKDK